MTCLLDKIALLQEMKSHIVNDPLSNNREVPPCQAPLHDCPGALSGGGWVALIGGPSAIYHTQYMNTLVEFFLLSQWLWKIIINQHRIY